MLADPVAGADAVPASWDARWWSARSVLSVEKNVEAAKEIGAFAGKHFPWTMKKTKAAVRGDAEEV